ncbi:MAG: hypothetical protein JF571_07895 [Asticcacaulis sp.]|nr:hypothetical protein [Asticcacaulis sp.]
MTLDDLHARLTHLPGIETRKALQSMGLMIGGKLFAFIRDGHLILKLPATQIDILIAAHDAVRFDGNRDKPMKEWIVMPPSSEHIWPGLAEDAYSFVSGK